MAYKYWALAYKHIVIEDNIITFYGAFCVKNSYNNCKMCQKVLKNTKKVP